MLNNITVSRNHFGWFVQIRNDDTGTAMFLFAFTFNEEEKNSVN